MLIVNFDLSHLTFIRLSSVAVMLSHIHRYSQPQSVSQNQGRTPLTSPSASNISGLAFTAHNSPTIPIFIDSLFTFEHPHRHTAVPISPTLRRKETLNSVRKKIKTNLFSFILKDLPLTEHHLTRNNDQNSFSLISNRARKLPSSSRQRKLPRDLELTNELYKITNQNSLRHNYTNNALSFTSHRSTANVLSFENLKTNEDIDSSV